jgi:uncharacterized coiled-coil DUF342 family protein
MAYNYDDDILPKDIDNYFDLKKDISNLKTELVLDIIDKLDNVSEKIDNISEKVDNIQNDNIKIREEIVDIRKDNVEVKNKLINIIEIIRPIN